MLAGAGIRRPALDFCSKLQNRGLAVESLQLERAEIARLEPSSELACEASADQDLPGGGAGNQPVNLPPDCRSLDGQGNRNVRVRGPAGEGEHRLLTTQGAADGSDSLVALEPACQGVAGKEDHAPTTTPDLDAQGAIDQVQDFRDRLRPFSLAQTLPQALGEWGEPRDVGEKEGALGAIRDEYREADRRRAPGLRDRTILLLLGRLGLRACEVARLRFQDVDWERATLQIRGKGGKQALRPLPQEIGEALLDYLERERPPSKESSLFLGASAPWRALTASAFFQLATRCYLRARMQPPSGRVHVLRHATATNLLRSGASLQDVGGLLRHSSLETTTLYAKVNPQLLAVVAEPWPEVPSC